MAYEDNAEKRSGDTDEDLLEEAKDFFKKSEEFDSHNRNAWVEDMRFARLGEQWPDAVRKQREIDGRPCLTINRLPAFIRDVTNDARQNKPSIRTHPVSNGADEETSEILNGIIKNIEYTSNADVSYDTALDHAASGGFGYWRIITDYAQDDAFEQDIKIERIINPLSVYRDYCSTSADSADWNQCGIADLWEAEDFKAKYPDADDSNFPSGSDSPDLFWNAEGKVRIAEYWKRREESVTLLKLSNGEVMYEPEYLKGKDLFDAAGVTIAGKRPTKTMKVTQYIMTGKEILETNEWAGKYIPIVPVYGEEVAVEGKTHYISLIRFAKDPQQMFNYWRTASTELVALAPKTPFIGPKGSFNTDADKWASANTVNHAYIEYDPVGGAAPQRQAFAGPPAGALQEAINSTDDMKSIMGIYDASLGARSNETSGIAINARQKQGDVATFHFVDNLSRSIRHTGRIIVDLIPKVYDTPRMMRIIKEDGKTEAVQVNQPFPRQIDPEDQQEQQDEAQGMMQIYDLCAGKYDVTCQVGPSYATKRQEASEQMLGFIQAFPPAAQFIGDLIAQNQDWPGADEFAKRLKKMLPPQLQGANPQVQQLQQQMQQMDAHAKDAVGQLQQQLQQEQEDKSLEAEKLKIDFFNAQTNRMKAAKEIQPSPGVQQEMGEFEKAQFDRETKLLLAEKDGEQAVKLKLLDLQGPAAIGLIDQQAEIVEGGPIHQVMQEVAHLKDLVTRPRKRTLITDENGEPIGARDEIDMGEE